MSRRESDRPLELSVRSRTTAAYAALMDTASDEERRLKRLGLAVARIEVARTGPPALLVGLSMPTLGIVRRGADVFAVNDRGEQVRGDGPIRAALGIRPAVDLIREDEAIRGQGDLWTGNGNAGLNHSCPAWSRGSLLHSEHDATVMASGGSFDACVWHCDARVTFELVQFVPASPRRWDVFIDGRRLSDKVRLVVSGQRLIERSAAIDPCADATSRISRSYADLRHLITTGYVSLAPGGAPNRPDGPPHAIRRDFGLDQLAEDEALRRRAIEGEIVELQLVVKDADGTRHVVDPVNMAAALVEKTYRRCDTVGELEQRQSLGERGLFMIDKDRARCLLVCARSAYPLHVLAIGPHGDTVLFDIVVSGYSNNGGSSVAELAVDLRQAGFTEALLLDNGGDVVMVSRCSEPGAAWPDPNGPCAIVPSSLRRTQWASLLLYRDQTGSGIDVRRDFQGDGGTLRVGWR